MNVAANVAPNVAPSVALSVPTLEAPGTTSRAAASNAAGTATIHPFFSLLDWLTNEVLAADVADNNTRPPKKEDKTGQQDSQGVLHIELPKPPAQIKPPIVLDQPNLIGNNVASADVSAHTEQAGPTQAEPAVTTAITPTALAFGALLTPQASGPKEIVAPVKRSAIPQGSSVNELNLIGSKVASADQSANTEAAPPTQVEPAVTTAITPTSLAFGALLTERTPGPKEVVAPAKRNAIHQGSSVNELTFIGTKIASTDQSANTEQAAPTQTEPVTTPIVTPTNLIFGALLTEHTPGPKEVVALAKSSAIPQGSSVNALKLAITSPTTDAKPGTDDHAEHTPEQTAERTKDLAPEKLVRTPAASDPPAHATIVSGATESKLERPQNNSSTKPEPSDTPKAELKTEINTPVRPQPTREISLKLTGTDAGSVNVRISERAGKVQVDVRTSDGELSRSLRSDWGDLVGRLEKRVFAAQTWTPGEQPASAASNSSRADANSDGDSQQSPVGSGQHGQNQNQDGRQKQNQRLEFLRKFESSMSFNTSSSIPDGNKEKYVNTST